MKKIVLLLFCIPLMGLDLDLFYAKLQEPTPQWMIEQIQEDLAPFTKELSKAYLDELFTMDYNLVRVRVGQGRLDILRCNQAITHATVKRIIPQLEAFARLVTLPDIDFLFTGHDALYSPLPVFCITKFTSIPGMIAMPDMFAMQGFEPAKSLLLEGNEIYSWETKKEMVFYRGADAGAPILTDWLAQPRTKLIALSTQYPELIDAKFVGLYAANHHPYASEKGFMSSYVSMREHPSYKYLINVDAMCAATPRVPLLLHSNSVFFKNNANGILWFFKAMKPYEHYVPVAEDLSDLLTQIEWAKTHDKECQQISENARKLAAEVLTEEAIYVYFYRLLEAYSNKQRSYYHQNQ